MAEPNPNPFASPEIEDTASSEVYAPITISAGRWVGLSTLSGTLLFAAYFAAVLGLVVVAYIFIVSRASFWGMLQASITPVAISCLVTGIYGACVGAPLGLCLGLLSYFLRDRKPLSLLVYLGVPASLLLTFLPLMVLVKGLNPRSAEEVLTMSCIVATLGSLMAGTHLVFNINRFLLKPHALKVDQR